MKYRKKPVIVDAIKWTGTNLDDIIGFVGESLRFEIYEEAYRAGMFPPVVIMKIGTLEGDMEVSVGDYVIKGIKGEFYPCKPDIFEATYEPAE